MENVKFYNATEAPFELYGLAKECLPELRRVPEDVAKKTSELVLHHSRYTSGIRVRFSTDSDVIAIKVISDNLHPMAHMTSFGSMGFDMYSVNKDGSSVFTDLFKPGDVKVPSLFVDGYEAAIKTDGGKMQCYQINFPLYSFVKELYIGVSPSAKLEKGVPYRPVKPFVFYGSSITQGACACRPGVCHAAIASRELNIDFYNIGMSGACKGEEAIVDYVSTRDASVFVLEYDHNSVLEELKERHARTAKRIRELNPDTPIIMATRPDFYGTDEDAARREVVLATYNEMKKGGDLNVYFQDGSLMYDEENRGDFTVDRVHPNDAGCRRIADSLIPILKNIYKGMGVL